MVSEVGELCNALIANDQEKIIDGFGDVLITLIMLSEKLDLDLLECLDFSYKEIEKRKGKTVNGNFMKEVK
jgi:NTP pyrophosphatase (non-canonical NTP hydrolase)